MGCSGTRFGPVDPGCIRQGTADRQDNVGVHFPPLQVGLGPHGNREPLQGFELWALGAGLVQIVFEGVKFDVTGHVQGGRLQRDVMRAWGPRRARMAPVATRMRRRVSSSWVFSSAWTVRSRNLSPMLTSAEPSSKPS